MPDRETSLDLFGGIVPMDTFIVSVNGGEPTSIAIRDSDDIRGELKRRLLDGEISSISFDAHVFDSGVENRNHFEFRPQDMQMFAQSFANKPFLRDHNSWSISYRDGTILSSSIDGSKFRQRISITTERGMLSFIEGQIDRFSIGFDPKKLECSVCHMNWYRCDHVPGRTYFTEDGNQTVAKIIFIEPFGNETSAVNTPAVPGTGILAQLCARKELEKEEITLMDKEEETPVVDESLSAGQEEVREEEFGNEGEATEISMSRVLDHVMSQVGSEESVAQLHASLGLPEIVAALDVVVKRQQELSDIVTSVTEALGVLNHNVGVLAGDPVVSNVKAGKMHWSPIQSGLSTSGTLKIPEPEVVDIQPMAQSVKNPTSAHDKIGTLNAASPGDPISERRAKSIARYNRRMAKR